MFDAGCMRPEWCFVIEEGGRDLGRAALWTLPGMDEPLDVVLLDVPWGDLVRRALVGGRTRKGALALSARDRARPRRAADAAPVAGLSG